MNTHDDYDDRTPGEKPSLQDQAERFSRQLTGSAKQIWLAGLGAFARAQAEGTRVLDDLVKEGEAVDARNRERAGDTPRWRDNVEEHLGEAREKAAGTWDKVEKAFDDRVQGVLKRLHIPTAEDVAALNARIDALTTRLNRAEARNASPNADPRPGTHQSPGSDP
ncbi:MULTISPECIES: phasin family protein [unclassified Stenotrophomonas]|jgi:poly(hydroxyalkanoate) granule-associated protein|uniref:phasin family protein n=1 Tax=unclassified Stenotrophomonas TaxID=196198 RepID=UPI0037161287